MRRRRFWRRCKWRTIVLFSKDSRAASSIISKMHFEVFVLDQVDRE